MKRTLIFLALSLNAFGLGAQSAALLDTLSESVVTGTRVAVSRDVLPVPVSVVGRQVIEQSDQNAVMPVLLEQVPGLFVTSRGVTGYGVSGGAAGSISLRGFAAGSGRVLVLIDGHPQFESIYGHPVADEYLAGNAQSVEVSRGPASVIYGSNAMGGAINIITRKPLEDANQLDIKLMGGSYGTYRGNISDSYNDGRFSAVASLSYDRTDGHRANSAFNSLGGLLKLGYDLSDNWNVTANANMMKAYAENPGAVTKPMIEGNADIRRIQTGLSIQNNYANTSGAVNLYWNWGKHIIDDGYSEGQNPQQYLFEGVDYMAGANIYQSFNPFAGNTLTAGVDLQFYGGNAFKGSTVYADHINLHEEGVYLLDQQSVGKFFFNAGARVERHSLYGVIFVPQAGVSFMPDDATSLKLSAAKGFRTPNMRELYMYAPANAELLPEDAWSYDFTAARHFLDNSLSMELSLFLNKGSNIIVSVMEDGRPKNRNAGEFQNKGVEFAVNYRVLPSLSFNANYSYLHMDNLLEGAPVHKVWFGGNWNPGRFSLSCGAMGIKDLYLVATGDNPVKSSYVDVNAKLAYQVSDSFSVFVRGQNLLNQKYETMNGFPMPGITVLAGLSFSLLSEL